MPRDLRSYTDRHKHDTVANFEHKLLLDNFPEYAGFTEIAKAIARAELELYPLSEFKALVNEPGNGG